ncbi:calmodulin-domain kinase (macronuclear) [Tetrahymena thermophila SB210]|uniref:Calcium-dependent protein kinase 1 n=1 Tax=Tetrahymena thermophila (strain SB210) TaxID=312017 RepID=Q229U9_TETTS|nr:calmodulin-domain kinase [Tetrahymena thermophila SB210]EAR82072.2 calmodulin-domain kinase [Tetrahymena thermophila SB210]|eukprot:XP_001029735.2 calmodulin-domain kinase [Tetrahymena thermophila SB210]
MATQPLKEMLVSEKQIPSTKASSNLDHLQIKFSKLINAKTGSYTDDYKLGGVLGVGAFSQVRKVTNRKTKAVRAMKIINKRSLTNSEDQQKFINEVEILRLLDHPHILKIYEQYQDNNNYYIILEMCTGGELFAKIIEKGSFSEKEASYIMNQIVSAVFYAHNHKIVHRDLKPENILLDITSDGTYNIKIVDWGTSKIFEQDEVMVEKFGTPYYIAPEVLKKSYNEKCDVWSCGVILYILLSGTPPFGGKNELEIMANVEKGQYSLEGDNLKHVSEEAKDLIRQMLEYNPKNRLSASQVLEHKWFSLIEQKETIDTEAFRARLLALRNFRAERKLQQAALTFIASQCTSKDEKNQLNKIFKALDKNGDGILTKNEIFEGYRQFMSAEEAEFEVNKIMNQVDIDKSGAIDYTEFILATMEKKTLSKEKLLESFLLFDQDGNGFITAEELKQVLGNHLSQKDNKIWLDLIGETDANGDGKISFEEFTEMMMKYSN